MIAKTLIGSTYDYGFCDCDHCHHEIGIGFCLLTARGRPDSFRGCCVNNRSDIRGGDRWRRRFHRIRYSHFPNMLYHSNSNPLPRLRYTQSLMKGIGVAVIQKLDIRNQKPLNCSKRYLSLCMASNSKTFPRDSKYSSYEVSASLHSWNLQRPDLPPYSVLQSYFADLHKVGRGVSTVTFDSRIIKSIYPVGWSSHESNR
jgi:hypothetical protein